MQHKSSWLKVLVFIICLIPLMVMIWQFFHQQLGANPIEAVTRLSGVWALRFLIIVLTVTPLRWLMHWHWLVRLRRMLGLYAFFYATVHMLLYLGLDQFFDWPEIWRDIIKRPFITVGFICFVMLIPLAVSSSTRIMKWLGGKRWQRLHQLVYPISLAAAVHFLMLVKADLREPLIYLIIIIFLLAVRLIHHQWKFMRTPA